MKVVPIPLATPYLFYIRGQFQHPFLEICTAMRSSRSQARSRSSRYSTRSPVPYISQPESLADGPVGEEAGLLNEFIHHHHENTLAPADDEDDEDDDAEEAAARRRLPWWKRPSPWW